MKQLLAPVLAAALTLPVAAPAMSEFTDEERARFRAEVRAYLLENPEVIFEAIDVLKQREAQAQAESDLSLVADNAKEIFDDGYSWVGGNPDGDITLVEFLDYRCGYCKKAHKDVAELLERDGSIRLIVKELPILGDNSVLASRFAIATRFVEGDAAYDAIKDALMAFNGDLNEASLTRLAEALELDAAAIQDRMDAPEVSDYIARTHQLAQKLDISGTPTFVMKDELLRGYLPYDQLKMIVDIKREE